MTKKEIAESIMKNEDLSKAQSERIVTLIFEEIVNGLYAGQEIAIAGFGKFAVVERAEREGVNPSTKEKLKIAACKVPKFKPAKQLKNNLN